jgi:hypothetical protein
MSTKMEKEKELHTLSIHPNFVSQCQYTFVDQLNQSYKDLVEQKHVKLLVVKAFVFLHS